MTKRCILLTLLIFCLGSATAQELNFENGRIQYDVSTGTLNVIVNGKVIIADAYSVVRTATGEYSSKGYSDREFSQTAIEDSFGTGERLAVTLSGDGMPEMQQIFYAYGGRPYFLTEVTVRGDQVSTNYMAPIVSPHAEIGATGDNRVLFVPFDNDTFIRYRSESMQTQVTNTSAEVTAFYEDGSRVGLVVGSVEHTDWKTGVRTRGQHNKLDELTVWGGYTAESVTRDKIPHGTLTGDSVKSPKVFVGYFDDWREGMEAYAKANAIADPRYVFSWDKPTPFGWNSWGAIQSNLNLNNAKAVVDYFHSQVPTFRNDDTAYIDLDSYWDNLISGGLEGDFTQLIDFVNYCKQRNLTPGIYWAPFVDWGKTDRKVEGSTYRYPEAWTKVDGGYHDLDGARAMDPTHPATLRRLDLVIDKFKRCGFEMIKIDFIGHAAIEADQFYDPSVTTGMQAFRKGMEYLIDKLDGQMFVYAAISPSLATGRYAHSRRIACDAYADIKATEYTLNSTTYGWWQTHIYNYIDADHLVFKNVTPGENRARMTSGVINGTLITGDDFSSKEPWTQTVRTLLQNQSVLDIARNGVAFRPADGNAREGASEVFVNTIGDDHYVALINYGEAKAFDLDLARLGIPSGEYTVKELFTGNSFSVDGSQFSRQMPSKDAAILKLSHSVVTGTASPEVRDTASLFPNPGKDAIHLQSHGRAIRDIKIFSPDGRLVHEQKNVEDEEYTVNIATYRRGVYVVQVVYMDNGRGVFKMVRE